MNEHNHDDNRCTLCKGDDCIDKDDVDDDMLAPKMMLNRFMMSKAMAMTTDLIAVVKVTMVL